MPFSRAVPVRSVGAVTHSSARAARDLRGFLRRTAASPGAADAVLAALQGVLPHDCGALSRWDAVTRRRVTVARVGYPASAVAVLDGRMHADPLFAQVHRARTPLRVRDVPPPRRRGEVFDAVIGPLGFRDGLTQCLFARDGRYLGMLNASTVDGPHPDDDAVALLDLLADDLSTVLDPLPRADPATGALARGDADGLLVPPLGPPVALSRGALVDLAGPRSALRPLLDDVLAGLPAPLGPLLVLRDARLLEVALEGGRGGVVVLHRTVPAPFGLTPRELQVLDAVSRGRTNVEAAAALGVSPRTVATHVEHLLAKTGCPNRSACARLAARLGLLV